MKMLKLMMLVIVSAMLMAGGCKSVTVENGATVVMNQQGRIFVGGKYTGLKGMVKQLKKEGYGHKYTIIVQIPPNTSQNAMTAISRELASNGYPHFLFRHDRKVDIELGPDPILEGIRESVPTHR